MTEEQEQQRELLGDNPIDDPDFDWLNFTEYDAAHPGYVNGLKKVLVSKQTPFVLGVYGGWGTGKTSLMMLLQRSLEDDDHPTVWFNPWKYDQKEEVWKALIRAVYVRVRTESPLGTLSWDQMQEAFKQVGQKAANVVGKLFGVGEIGDEFEALLAIAPFFSNPFESVFHGYLDQLPGKNKRFIVFIDDLDRCSPEAVIEVLEALKLYLDVKRCVFVIGVNDKVVGDAVQHKYASSEKDKGPIIEGAHYLEKIVQLPFHIPPPDEDRLANFIEKLIASAKPPTGVGGKAWEDYIQQVADATDGNPRQIKRFVSTVDLIDKIAPGEVRLEGQPEPVPFDRLKLAKVVLLQFIAGDFYATLRRYPELLYHYQELARKRDEPPATDKEARQRAVAEMMQERLMAREEAEKVDALTRDPRLLRVLVDEPHFDSEEEAQCYIQYSAGGRGPSGLPPSDETLGDLLSPDSPVRDAAGKRVREAGEEAVRSYTDALVQRLRSDDEADVRARAAVALDKIGTKEAVPELIKALRDPESGVRRVAAVALGELGANEAVGDLIEVLSDQDQHEDVRSAAAWGLGLIGAKETLPNLSRVLGDEDEDAHVRGSAAGALGLIGAKEAVPDLREALRGKDAVVRGVAAGALAMIGGEEAVPDLIKALGDENARAREIAANALQEIGTPEALKALKEDRSK